MQSQSQDDDSDGDRSPPTNAGRQFSLDKIERGKKSQYLSMRRFAVHRQMKTHKGQAMQVIFRRRPVNKKLNSNYAFRHQDDVLDLLFTRNTNNDVQMIRKTEIAILNKFYQKSSEKISSVLPGGSIAAVQKKEYCKTPKIQFKVRENPRHFQKQSDENRFQEKQGIARSFVFRDYGYTSYETEIAENPFAAKVGQKTYRNILATIITQAFRKCESFAIQQCMMGLKPLNRAELKVLFVSLLNCRTHFSQNDCQTLLNYVSMTFCLGDVTITADSTVKLMSAIHQILKRRIEQKSGDIQANAFGREDMVTSRGGFTDEKYQMHKIWNGEMQRLLLETYRKEPDLSKIVKIFKRSYPKRQCFFNPDAIKTRINRTLRESFKKLQFLRQIQVQNGAILPEIESMPKMFLTAVMDSSHLYRLRLMLLDVNISDSCSHNLLHSTIKALNESSRVWQSMRAEQLRNNRQLGRHKSIQKQSLITDLDLSQLIIEQ